MSDLLSIGASGVRAYQTALSTVGENIANVGATGYSRRTVGLTEVPASDRLTGGNGVVTTGVNRSTDTYNSAALRSATSDLGRTTSGAQWLDRIDDALTGNALTTRVTSFFNAAQSLAAQPDSSALRTTMTSAADSTAIAFTATGKAFDQVATDIDSAGTNAAQTLTALASSLTQINDGLGRSMPNTPASAQLTDQRDQILGQMSGLVDVTSSFDALGRATVAIGGSSGPPLVKGTQSGGVAYSRDGNGDTHFSYTVNGVSTEVTANGGTLAGIADGAQRLAAIRASLDSTASTFVTTVNSNQAAGQDQAGAAGAPFFTVGTSPTDITMALTDGSKIAAAAPGGGTRDASNLATLQQSRLNGGFETSLSTLVTDNATAHQQKTTIADAQTAIRDGAQTALSTSTGVNLDSEAIDLMRYQQAYAASSRVIQVARETMQSILDIR